MKRGCGFVLLIYLVLSLVASIGVTCFDYTLGYVLEWTDKQISIAGIFTCFTVILWLGESIDLFVRSKLKMEKAIAFYFVGSWILMGLPVLVFRM